MYVPRPTPLHIHDQTTDTQRAQQYGGCKIFFEKADDTQPGDCEGSGNDMWNGYQQIRGTCNVCGYKTFTNPEGSECRLKIDYVFCKPDAEDCGTEFGDRQWGKWT